MPDLFFPSGSAGAGAVKSGGEEIVVGTEVVVTGIIRERWIINGEEEDKNESDQKGCSEKQFR